MKIAVVSKLWEATSPVATGGTGACVGYLVEELQKRGHEVSLFAASDSMRSVELVGDRSSGDFRRHYSEPIEYLNIAAAFDRRCAFDVIHCHNEYKSLFFGAASATPSLHTVRYGEFFSDELAVFDRFRHLNFASISQAVKNMLPDLNWRGVVQNGLDLRRFPFCAVKEDYLLFLARLSPQKGPDIAIRIAQAAGKRLIMAGKRSDKDAAYLAEKVDPFIDGERIKYLGEVDFATKIDLLARATALLHPISYLEAFGMTIIEAMACGTPVIAFDRGAIPEVIVHGRTGFIVTGEAEMIETVGRVGVIKPADCRRHVEENFTVEKMAEGYEKLYHQIST